MLTEKKDKFVEICYLITKKGSFAYEIGKAYFLTNGLFVSECDSEGKENLNAFLKECEILKLTNIHYEKNITESKTILKNLQGL